ncbi:hypothetical protein BD779DRAFT_1497063 [Infundibulicybe gibba]|nr:hypothetical protein BD779DRAFT_1497063 [Infundibulicybe gibba]
MRQTPRNALPGKVQMPWCQLPVPSLCPLFFPRSSPEARDRLIVRPCRGLSKHVGSECGEIRDAPAHLEETWLSG